MIKTLQTGVPSVMSGGRTMKRKRIHFPLSATILILAIFLSLAGCGAESRLKKNNETATRDGVTVTLKKATAKRTSHPDRYNYMLSGTIENNTAEGIMKVIYTFAFYDKNGEEFRSFGIVYDGEDKAIPPYGKVDFYHDDIKWGAQSVPASVTIGIGSVQTETQLPPAKLPQSGDFLYKALDDEKLADIKNNLPVELSFHIDQGGYGRTATFSKGELLDRAVEKLCNIRIGEKVDEWVTDNYNWIRLVWEDGSETYISLNMRNLEYSAHSNMHTYRLDNLNDFWAFASDYLEEDQQ